MKQPSIQLGCSVATDGVIDSFDEFLPQTQSFYKAIYIAWCKAERFAIAA
ncbi:hypothetical protein Q2T42_26350 [Leptolyngbya boryana CZ1]|uniref:Uncharacterized protein n=1 Tax=Leptolyngbya boryana CZ1 TaxID=3060204 RepID=A0AA96WW38_LEPBY|nr:hypothetical protein [Leptolyngbya boryana]WNZ45314.1 hypothetical protein Q2T42_26350 [Leptolyngbya boryana CZ1]